jgi:hypothetical protein
MYSNKDDIYYKKLYFKYKTKYLKLKQIGGVVDCVPGTEISNPSDLKVGQNYRYLGINRDRINTIVNLEKIDISTQKKTFKVINNSDEPIKNEQGMNIDSFELSGDIHNMLCKTIISPSQLSSVNTVDSQLILDIETQLRTLFNINVKLDSYDNMEINFNIDLILQGDPIMIGETFSYNEQTYIKSGSGKKCGENNCTIKYKSNDKFYILRYDIRGSDNLFKSFYENLKHFILYIVIQILFNNKLIIPKPIGMAKFIINASDTRATFGMIMECGEETLEDNIFKNIKNNNVDLPYLKNLERICANIYENLYLLNSKPTIFQFKHNDLHYGNILLLDNGIPLIIDFGLTCLKIGNIDFICKECSKLGKDSMLQLNTYNNVLYDMIHLLNRIYYFIKLSRKEDLINNNFFNLGQNIIFDNLNIQFIRFDDFLRFYEINYKIYPEITPEKLYLELKLPAMS